MVFHMQKFRLVILLRILIRLPSEIRNKMIGPSNCNLTAKEPTEKNIMSASVGESIMNCLEMNT